MPETATRGWPHGPTQFEQRRGNAITRVVTGVVAIPIVIGAIWLGGWVFFLFVALISSGALLEFYWLTEKRGALPNKKLGIIAGLLLTFAFMHGVSDAFFLDLFGVEQAPATVMLARFALVLGVLLLFAIATMIDQMFRKEGSPILNNVATFAGVTYISLFLGTLVGIMQLFATQIPFGTYLGSYGGHWLSTFTDFGSVQDWSPYGGATVIAILVTIWTCDSAAYYAGRSLGKHKLFERVSPKKTWEGSIAGALAAVGAMIGLRAWIVDYLTLGDAIAIGAIVGIFGQLGDLAESHLKRDAGVKDSSQLIPGHGGLFDRFDSLLFVAPLVYLYLNFVVLTR